LSSTSSSTIPKLQSIHYNLIYGPHSIVEAIKFPIATTHSYMLHLSLSSENFPAHLFVSSWRVTLTFHLDVTAFGCDYQIRI